MCRTLLQGTNETDGFHKKPSPLLPPPSPHTTFNYEHTSTSSQSSSSSSSSSSYLNRISPVLVMAMTILAAIFFLSGLLHLLIRYLSKKPTSSPIYHSSRFPATSFTSSSLSSSSSQSHHPLQRQLQQLFRLQDSGLEQAFIDSLPVFYYKDIIMTGSKEPFDCAVCLCEFSDQDKLRLLPPCNHAFHIGCIDTWLLSNSTCPLCRGSLLSSSCGSPNPIENSSFETPPPPNDGESASSGNANRRCDEKAGERVLSVRLGKLRSLNGGGGGGGGGGESSRFNMDARRCYSLGRIHEYVVEGESNLRVALFVDVDLDLVGISSSSSGKRMMSRSGRTCKGESFSVSKIWQWSNHKSRFPASAMDSPTATLPFRRVEAESNVCC